MSFFDPTIINESLPERWFEFDAHVEVDNNNNFLINYLIRTGWICFSDGVEIVDSNLDDRHLQYRSKWFGLPRSIYRNKKIFDLKFG